MASVELDLKFVKSTFKHVRWRGEYSIHLRHITWGPRYGSLLRMRIRHKLLRFEIDRTFLQLFYIHSNYLLDKRHLSIACCCMSSLHVHTSSF